MAILFGTTGDGTTLPVLVDQFGNLLAKGIPGDEGQPGPPGPPGGAFALPPDPIDGDVLGWENGQLVWIAGTPLPSGTYGPFIYSDIEDTLTVPQDVSLLINGQQLIMTDNQGSPISVLVETSEITNVNGNVLSFPDNTNFDLFYEGEVVQPGVGILNISGSSNPPTITVNGGSWKGSDGSGDQGDGRYVPDQEWSSYFNAPGDPAAPATSAFNGDNQTYMFPLNNGTAMWQPPETIPFTSLKIQIGSNGGGAFVNGIDITSLLVSTVNVFTETDLAPLGISSPLESIGVIKVTSGTGSWLYFVEVNGGELIDSSIPGIAGATKISKNESGTGSVQVATGNIISLSTNNRQWIDDYYVTSLEQ